MVDQCDVVGDGPGYILYYRFGLDRGVSTPTIFVSSLSLAHNATVLLPLCGKGDRCPLATGVIDRAASHPVSLLLVRQAITSSPSSLE